MRLLVLRPEPGAHATAAAACARGFEVIVAPLFAVRALDWAMPAGRFDALAVTSANALRHGGGGLDALRHLPLYAVGAATAEAALARGFADVRVGSDDAASLFAAARRDGHARLLHLAGREHRAFELPGLAIVRVAVYASDEIAVDLPPGEAIALVHSPRAAAAFAARVDPGRFAIAAISARAAAAAGEGWRALAIAETPTDAALLAAAARLCERGA